MDYEKEYKKLVSKIDKAYLYAQTDSTKAVLEEIRPELKESEGERIKGAIIDHLKDNNLIEWATWLEKQGEHQKFRDSIQVGDKVTRNKDGILVNLSQLNRVAKKDNKQGEQIDLVNKEYWRGYREGKQEILDKYSEQKPTDKVEPIEWSGKIKSRKVKGVLKEMLDEKLKSAWSEEDEETLKIIDRDLQEFYSRRKAQAGSPLFESQMQNIRWLKSLKDRVGCEVICTTKWKPTDEQMKALDIAILYVIQSGTWEEKALNELREQLKKLREE